MDLRQIERRYDRAASAYDQHDALEREVGSRLLERIAFSRLEPGLIIDLGCGTGRDTRALKERFPESRIIGLDLSTAMLQHSRTRHAASESIYHVKGDLTRLPLAARSSGLVFCNLALQWAGDFAGALNEIRRVLKPEGMLLFTVPGPESLRELRQLQTPGLESSIPIYMPDLRDVGDCLVAAGYRDPVMDAEIITLSYGKKSKMKEELGVTGGAGFTAIPGAENDNTSVDVSFEIVYGVAFGPADGQPVRTQEGDVATFSADQLKKL